MKIPAEKQDVAPKKTRLQSKTVEISLPIADEIREVAAKLDIPYETVRGLVVARITPEIHKAYLGRASALVRRELAERLPLSPVPVLLAPNQVEIVEGVD